MLHNKREKEKKDIKKNAYSSDTYLNDIGKMLLLAPIISFYHLRAPTSSLQVPHDKRNLKSITSGSSIPNVDTR